MNDEFRKALLVSMIRVRMVEERIAEEYPREEMRCPVHLSIGQEGVAAGACAAMRPGDFLLSTHRAHAHYLAKGGGLKPLIAELYGKATGCSSGKGGSMHLQARGAGMLGSTSIVGGSLPVGVGAAFGTWLSGGDAVTTVFFGDGATEEGVFAESLNFAALKKLPVVFICENNLYSVCSPLAVRQSPDRDRVALARAHGMAGERGDGNDVEQVYRLAAKAVDGARSGNGPSFLEFSTYRWREHCGPNYDNDIGYRNEEEFASWRERCPVEKYQAGLFESGVIDENGVSEMRVRIAAEIEEAFDFAKESPFPEPSQLKADLYAGAGDD